MDGRLGEYMDLKINDIINFCYDDTEGIEFQLFLIALKCLIPYEDNIGCFFDMNRYKKEIELFAYYKNGDDDIIDYLIKHKIPSNNNDKLLEFKIIPIILSNTMWEQSFDEVFKAVAFYTLNINTILDALLISSAIHEFINDTEIKDIEIITKERLINFSVKKAFANNQIKEDKNYIIDFEKERIKEIIKPVLFEDNRINRYKSLSYIFKNMVIHVDSDKNEYSIGNNSMTNKNKADILGNYSQYLCKLRKGIINPEKLKISDKIPDIKECLKYPVFNHPLLGRCKIVEREKNEIIIRNKSGTMRFRI